MFSVYHWSCIIAFHRTGARQMNRFTNKLIRSILLLLFIITLISCGGGGGGGNTTEPSGSDSPKEPDSSSTVISGNAAKGTGVSDANVSVNKVNDDGSIGELLGNATTSTDGSFTISLTVGPDGPIAVVVSDGEYTRRVDSETVNNDSICAMLAKVTDQKAEVSVNPLTDMVCSLSKRITTGEVTPEQAMNEATELVKTTYGLTENPNEVFPEYSETALTTNAGTLALVAAAMEEMGNDFVKAGLITAADRDSVFRALSQDIADGKMDGKDGETDVALDDDSPLPATAGSSDFLSALGRISPSVMGPEATEEDIQQATSALQEALSQSDASKDFIKQAASGSSGIATMAFDGKQYIFPFAGNKGIVKIDVTQPETPKVSAIWPLPDVFPVYMIGTTGVMNNGQPQVFVYSASHLSKAAVLLNARTGEVEWSGDLDILSNQRMTLLGTFIRSAEYDHSRQGVWMATSDGYGLFDLNTKKLTTYYPDETMNVPFHIVRDAKRDLLYVPSKRYINLTDNRTYTYDETAFNEHFQLPWPHSPSLMGQGDIDSNYNVAAFTDRSNKTVYFFDLETAQTTVTDEKSGSINPSSTGSTLSTLTDGIQFSAWNQIFIEEENHLAFFFSDSGLAVAELQDPSGLSENETWRGFTDWRLIDTSKQDMRIFINAISGAATIKNINNNKSYAYLPVGNHLQGLTNVYQFDMESILKMETVGTSGDAAHTPINDPFETGEINTINVD